MKNYIIYIESGEIVRYGTCIDDVFDTLPEEDQFIIEGYCTEYQYVKNGIVVDMPPKPVGEYVFNYITGQWVFDEQLATADALNKRQKLLVDSDWTQLPDVPLSDKQAWADYRQQLRDITSQPNFPNDIIWPIKPTEGA